MTEKLCTVTGCRNLSVTVLGTNPFCCDHFVARCHEELEVYSRLLAEHRLTETATVSARRFLQECLRQADTLESKERYLTDKQREGVANIILQASELGRNLRRSPRMAIAIRVMLSSEAPNNSWVEEARTQLVSRHGALVQCRHTALENQTVVVERLDTGQKDKARVAWLREKSGGNFELGLEFANNENFWGIDWSVGA